MRAITPSDIQPKAALSLKAMFLDIFERAILTIIFIHFAWVFLINRTIPTDVSGVLLVVGEIFPFIFILLREPSETLSRRLSDWVLGVTGAVLPLLVTPAETHPVVPILLCYLLMISGSFVQVSAKIALGRRFGLVAANRGVVINGPYRFVRHPMYAGYTITHIGFLLAMPVALNALLYAMTLSVQVLRIMREERVLQRDQSYVEFAKHVRYRLVPGIF